ncbi:MAG: YbcC family protein [Rubripirellula sp.]
MSIGNSQQKTQLSSPQTQGLQTAFPLDFADVLSRIDGVLDSVQARIAPVWPLKDYVAVNPYAGVSDQKFLAARKHLRSVSDLETLMSVDYYRQQFVDGLLCKADIDAAVDELVADGVTGAERIDVNQVVSFLREQGVPCPTADAEFVKASDYDRPLRSFVELLDRHTGSHWNRIIREEISKQCSAHYDTGQAAWASPWQGLPLFQAWRSASKHDRSFEILGVSGFRRFVAALPHDPRNALVALLHQLGVPSDLWEDFLLCESLTMPGWSAWTKRQHREAEWQSVEDTDFIGLIAIRLAYQAALSSHFDFRVDWNSVAMHHAPVASQADEAGDEDLLRYALLKAGEIAFRKRLLSGLTSRQDEHSQRKFAERALAQMVFCIDVRSERIRRQLEASSAKLETFGFAGFFGLPIEFVPLGESEGSAQVPVLLSPQFKVTEELDTDDASGNTAAIEKRSVCRFLKKAWVEFQTSALGCFAFVESTGLFYAYKLLARSIGAGQSPSSCRDGVAKSDRPRLGPTLRGLSQQGVTISKQADMAESILRGIGIVDNFARMVVFCGHGSRTENNPLQAGLDCGACGGHSGESNARFAAKLLNQQSIRQALDERGISIPEDTQFVAALHNTTTDELEFFEKHELPVTHTGDLQELEGYAEPASKRTRNERLSVLPGASEADLVRRSGDWSEIRPEWGLAGNAAFIAAPRELTKSNSLDGRSFLHSYDYRNDPEFAVLEQIMTAPLVVAHWINMQYYASTVDPIHFGSGNKAVHNVVGQFGVFSGNGGDLMTGLPWQSVHDGSHYQHHPLRLLAVLAAPREAIEVIVGKHEVVRNLIVNGWLQLIAIEDDSHYRYTERQTWDVMLPESAS